ncbi:carbohydrate kinase family protein [Thermosipho ferrireducens]|uniref:Carbohydrate kinase family protein n=1 Tax=Thermosipho ferrireducens TaxID=2571116 RepID=A0ABX7S6B5_9BACT|nr:carbohydrate kinase family protein [Thermosipho ferrireducens]QTA37285.1 carbohydrate kinase family protein [Thermosipho ferrireducens]
MYYRESEKEIDVFCVGKTNLDIYYYVEKITQEANHVAKEFTVSPGGKATNVAILLSKLGINVALVSALGNDTFGKKVSQLLSKENLKYIPKLKDAPTALTSIIIEKDGKNTMFHNLGANACLTPDDIPPLNKYTYVQTGIPVKTIISVIQTAPKVFVELSEPSQFEKLKNYLWKVDCVSLNEEEINSIFKHNNIDRNINSFLKYTPRVLLKMGEKGILFKEKNGTCVNQPAIKTNIVNTTGAGDAVSAGYIYGVIKGWDINETLKFCVKLASKVLKSKSSTY